MNDSKMADYKGIELKSKRIGSTTTGALFTNTPDWALSKCKSGREIADNIWLSASWPRKEYSSSNSQCIETKCTRAWT